MRDARGGGESWTELTQKRYVDFGFPVAVHPQSPDVAWIAPMDSDEEHVSIDGALVTHPPTAYGVRFA